MAKALLTISEKQYDPSSLKEAIYVADGQKRTVRFIDTQNNIVDDFNYEVFWLDEADMLRFAMELPEDDERDLLKFISNK